MNIYDKEKYCTPAEEPTNQEMESAVKSLVKYMKTFDTRPAKQAVLDSWPVLYYLFGNIDTEASTFRGEKFLYKNRKYGSKLLKQAARGHIEYDSINSWSISPKIALRFAYYYVGTKESLFNNEPKYDDRFTLCLFLAGVAHQDDGLDLTDTSKLNSSFGINEKEIIMPPGKIRCEIMSAAFIDKNNKIYFYNDNAAYREEAEDAYKSLVKCCIESNRKQRLNEDDDNYYDIFRIKDINHFIRLYDSKVANA